MLNKVNWVSIMAIGNRVVPDRTARIGCNLAQGMSIHVKHYSFNTPGMTRASQPDKQNETSGDGRLIPIRIVGLRRHRNEWDNQM